VQSGLLNVQWQEAMFKDCQTGVITWNPAQTTGQRLILIYSAVPTPVRFGRFCILNYKFKIYLGRLQRIPVVMVFCSWIIWSFSLVTMGTFGLRIAEVSTHGSQPHKLPYFLQVVPGTTSSLLL